MPDLITKLPDEFSNEPKVAESSCKETIPSSVFNIISPATSNVKSPEDKSNSVPFKVKLSTTREAPVIIPVDVTLPKPLTLPLSSNV